MAPKVSVGCSVHHHPVAARGPHYCDYGQSLVLPESHFTLTVICLQTKNKTSWLVFLIWTSLNPTPHEWEWRGAARLSANPCPHELGAGRSLMRGVDRTHIHNEQCSGSLKAKDSK